MTKRADAPSFVLSTLSLSAILNDKELALASELQDRIHVTGISGKMHDQNSARLRSQSSGNAIHANVLCFGIHVSEDGRRSADRYSAGRCDKSPAAGDDVITYSDA